jgi:hypothetical protein
MTSPFILLFASNNRHKAEEINSILGEQFQIITLAEAGIVIDIPEPHDTIAANAAEKSSVIFQLTSKNLRFPKIPCHPLGRPYYKRGNFQFRTWSCRFPILKHIYQRVAKIHLDYSIPDLECYQLYVLLTFL